MDVAAPFTHPLRPWHSAAVALAVAAQCFALAHASPWLHPAWAAVLAVAMGLAALPSLRSREVLLSLAARLALTLAAAAVAGLFIGELIDRGATPSSYPRARPVLNVAAAACWLWALHAPLTMSRWWVRARPAQDGALEVAEPLGLSMLATAGALTAQNASRAWSLASGTAWSTGLCAALGVGLVAWAWVGQWRRRAWMRRVLAGDDATWELVDADDSATADPWTHAGDGAGAPRMLRARGDGEHYRAAGVRVPVARVGARDGRGWWVRRALHVAALGWGLALAHWGTWKLLHIGPRDRWNDVVDAIRAVGVGRDPCVLRGEGGPGGAAGLRSQGLHPSAYAEVSASGRVTLTPVGETERFGTWCVPPETARRWLAADPSGVLAGDDPRVRTTPELPAPVDCARGRWCSITWGEPTTSGEDGQSHAVATCTLQINGWFRCEEGREHRAGRVSPAAARALLEAAEAHAASVRAVATEALPALFVGVGGAPLSRALDFEGSQDLGRELRRRLWPVFR